MTYNELILIENGNLKTYSLDDRPAWEVGRPSDDSNPDIRIHIPTVSRKHGVFMNIYGYWYYMDLKSKNSTVYNSERIEPVYESRIRPISLKDGDTFLFGGDEKAPCEKLAWAMFSTSLPEGEWRAVPTGGHKKITFSDGTETVSYKKPSAGLVVRMNAGAAIYMGEKTYLLGNVEVF